MLAIVAMAPCKSGAGVDSLRGVDVAEHTLRMAMDLAHSLHARLLPR
jgi:hypothetical protein